MANKFDYEALHDPDCNYNVICFNKAIYTKEQALELGKQYLYENFKNEGEAVEIREGYVAWLCYYFDGERYSGYVQRDDFVKGKGKIPVWVVE